MKPGYFIRSDQYSFVQTGIPVLQLDTGYKSDQPGIDPLTETKKWSTTIYHSRKTTRRKELTTTAARDLPGLRR